MSNSDKLAAIAAADEGFTAAEVGSSVAELTKLEEQKLVKRLSKTRRTGKRGRPAVQWAATAKLQKLA